MTAHLPKIKIMKNFFQATAVWLVVVILLSTGCGQPRLGNLSPNPGPPGAIVEVIGSNLSLSNVIWDAGTANETVIPSSFLSSRFFTVPLNATAGAHPVRLKKGNSLSTETIVFNVVGNVLRRQPRIDYITCSQFSIDANNQASFFLLISGANIDVGAKVRINGASQAAFVSNVLRNNTMTVTDPTTLAYPIPNYCMLWTALSNQSPGSSIDVQVENLDGGMSNVVAYTVATSLATLDSDADGLPDDWENDGLDADGDGTVDVDLPALGADPHRKDLFVEVDWMNGFAPNNAIWAAIEGIFTNAPVLNANGVMGIALHIDRGQAGAGGGGGTVIPASTFIRYDDVAMGIPNAAVNLHTLKTTNFNNNRLNVYRYCIFANDSGHSPGSSGQAENIPANDFYVSLGAFIPIGGTNNQQIGTFVHELGHMINLRHGGFENLHRKPPYNSIMRYGDPGQFPGIDTNCNNNGDAVFTFSQGMRAPLNENVLNENIGVCDNIPFDWTGNGMIQNPVSISINGDALLGNLLDSPDWGSLILNFRAAGSGWGNN